MCPMLPEDIISKRSISGISPTTTHRPSAFSTLEQSGEDLCRRVLLRPAPGSDLILHLAKHILQIIGSCEFSIRTYSFFGFCATFFVPIGYGLLLVMDRVTNVGLVVQYSLDYRERPRIRFVWWRVRKEIVKLSLVHVMPIGRSLNFFVILTLTSRTLSDCEERHIMVYFP